jgi:excisionase family DNA binding protein
MEEAKLAYTIFEACQLVGVGRTTLYSAIKTGALKTHKVGRRTLVTQRALLAWLNGLPSFSEVTCQNLKRKIGGPND